ncbi:MULTISPECIES: RidA family protein [unclassified Microbacterium]|uniref:RidA family protein n=1 Tax=unclassified Microbacterium TaxID=2609290 RepID=UPI000EA9E1DE|nr:MULTISPECIES: RidA family protein [unclassified Microbacterium]MBT2486532.1 RidA family protein [Microbacterium sp. ISL-108]RKN69225.1 RidA family protein [Microbacterium sp. CGR2]
MSRRRSVAVLGFEHRNPVPVASRIGPFLFSGALTGRAPQSAGVPADLAAQMANVFDHVGRLMHAADASTDDIVKMTFWLVDPRDREDLNRFWLTMFPDPASRPARHVLRADLDEGMLVHADLVAVLTPHLPEG